MFKDYNFKDYINKGLESIKFVEATNIQTLIIPKVLEGINIIGKSQTGTGKTHAFILPILQKLDESLLEVQSVIVAPTRELATQIYEEFLKITKFSDSPIDVRIYVGGNNREQEKARLAKSQPQIIIGTIGKLTDLAISENILKIHTAKIVVIDEADMVMEMSEIEEIDKVFARFLNPQVLSFSATIPNSLITFLNKYIAKNEVIDLVGKNIQNENIEHIFIPTKNKNKDELLIKLLKVINPYLALIFANTVVKVDEITEVLGNAGLKIAKITGSLPPRERKQILKKIKDNNYQFVVCSDIASRGMDFEGVSHVINYELPQDIEFYIHRTGRTARHIATGYAISFYDYEDDNYLKKLKDKNITGTYMNLVDGELKVTKERNVTYQKTKAGEYEIHQKHPVGKHVKPGYKKKRKELIAKEIKKQRRSKLNEIYKRKAKMNSENRE